MTKTKKLMAAMAVFGAVAFAGAVNAGPKYGMAGCGLGSVLLGPGGGYMQIFAATTNGTSGNQTFGITTGTSNCVEDSAAYNKMQQEIFVSVNYKGLEQEMAAGKGKKLDAFANLLGCPAKKLATVSQKNHSKLFDAKSKEDPTQLISNVKATPELAASCTKI